MISPEDLSRLQLIRARIGAGEQIPLEEMKEAIRLLRADRIAAAARAKATRAKGGKAAAVARSANELLGGLGIKLS